MDEQTKTLITFIRHIGLVRKRLIWLAHRLEERGHDHDLSKFSEGEFEGFTEINRIARQFPYGSKEYMDSIKDNNAVSLHHSRNPHHPEFFPTGIDAMNLFEIIEMVCDWLAACETYGQTSFEDALQKQIDRFGLQENHLYLIRLIAEAIE